MNKNTHNSKSRSATNEQRLDLIMRAKRGDSKAFNEYYQLNIALLKYIVYKYAKGLTKDEVDDLYQEGLIGLHRGVEVFDLEKNAKTGKPEGYIYLWVSAYCSRFRKHLNNEKKHTCRDFIVRSGDNDSPSKSYYSETLADPSLPVDDQMYNLDLDDQLEEFISNMPIRKQIITRYRLNDAPNDERRSLRHIGELFNVSHERIRQLELDARFDLLKFSVSKDLLAD